LWFGARFHLKAAIFKAFCMNCRILWAIRAVSLEISPRKPDI